MALTAQQLFGSFDPESARKALQLEEEKNMLAVAQLTPEQRRSLYAQQAGAGVGNIVTSLFGAPVQDPRLQQAQMAQEAYQEALNVSGGDASSPAFFTSFANSAARRNLPTLAQQAANQAATLQSEIDQGFQRRASGTASLVKATADKRVPLADRLVELDTKKATLGLTPAEENERTALERVVKIQAPKEPGMPPLESEEARYIGRGAGEQFTKVTTLDLDAADKRMGSIRELQVLSGQVDTGAFAEVKAKAQSLAKDLGINLGDPTNAQTLRAAIERGVAQSQLEQKGVQTDRDAARYRTASVLLTNTPAANQYIVDYQMVLTERAREKARFFEDFRTRKGTSVGAEGAWQQSIRDKDIFDTPTLSKYKDTFKMNDLAKRVKGGTASQNEKSELAGLMRQYGLTQVKIAQ
jgi:uncharacterized protein YnzC (UPF0291/DUF896 family)